jgi:hypothetical protein
MNEATTTQDEVPNGKIHKLPKSKARKKRVENSLSKGEILAKGVATGIVVSAISHTGRGIAGFISRQPLAMFTIGIMSGYFLHKYRNEIIYIADHTTEHSKQFLLRQKENFNDLITEAETYAAERKHP